MSTTQERALETDEKATMKPSPVCLTSWPQQEHRTPPFFRAASEASANAAIVYQIVYQ